ncbi:MAG: ATP-binding protein [Candidatus Omnitrophica bacterium]|nr:ATP-binding protein [Candidatus Omnitrophota bacterium]
MKKDIFFDRNLYLEILRKHFNNLIDGYRQNLAFIGNEMVGKTSLILNFLNKFEDNRILPIYISVNRENFKFFIDRFIGSLLYSFLKNSGIELKENFHYLIKKAENFIPLTVKKINEIRSIARKNKTSIFLELLSLCDIINKETKKFCVVIFDEFQNLEMMGIKNLYKDWIKVLVLQKNTMFIIISSARFKTKKILNSSLNLLFGKFELIEVEPFDHRNSKEFLIDRLNGLILGDKMIDFVVSICGGIPFYLKIIADSILYKIKNDDASSGIYVNKNIVFEVLLELLFEENGALYQKLFNYLNKISTIDPEQNALEVLCCISCGYNRIKDMIRNLHIPIKIISKIIYHLLETDIIIKNGDFFKINDRLFNLWLRLIYQRRLLEVDFNSKSQSPVLRKELEKIYNEFLNDLNKNFLEKLIEIMYLFENAHVNIDNKRIDLTSFREIKSFSFESSGIKEGLIARSTNYLWIVAVKQSPLKEEDIEEFFHFCNKYKEKKQKRIIITPYQIDANVRLKAMEEKILTWELKNINLLCELFNRPVIIY